MTRRRYRITFYVTEGPDEDGKFADPEAIAMGVESELNALQRDPHFTLKLDSEVTAEAAPRRTCEHGAGLDERCKPCMRMLL